MECDAFPEGIPEPILLGFEVARLGLTGSLTRIIQTLANKEASGSV
jgi:hypothetical protein